LSLAIGYFIPETGFWWVSYCNDNKALSFSDYLYIFLYSTMVRGMRTGATVAISPFPIGIVSNMNITINYSGLQIIGPDIPRPADRIVNILVLRSHLRI
jgi:hypothetical protein